MGEVATHQKGEFNQSEERAKESAEERHMGPDPPKEGGREQRRAGLPKKKSRENRPVEDESVI